MQNSTVRAWRGSRPLWMMAACAGWPLGLQTWSTAQPLSYRLSNRHARPNLVATVQGEANFERETLTRVIEARARATAIQVTPEMLQDAQAMQRFQAAQGELGSALSRLLAVAEQYPNLKANQAFADLRVQLEGTENRIAVARNRYIQAVQRYNTLARSFPTNLTARVFGYEPKPSFAPPNEAGLATPPKVEFPAPSR